MLIRDAELAGHGRVDVRIVGERVQEVATRLAPGSDEQVLDAGGGALLPGLHDHHLHLLSLAAAMLSVRAGPPEVTCSEQLAAVLAAAPPGPVRAVGYFESVAGHLDRDELDRLAPGRCVRLQHRSGALWILSSAAIDELGELSHETVEGLERDEHGRLTGRLYRLDAWLRERTASGPPPALDAVGRRLASYGVTGLTDATPTNDLRSSQILHTAAASGALPQRLRLMGGDELRDGAPRKILLDERALPALDELVATIRSAHDHERPVAIHCVTRLEVVVAAEALREAGVRSGDRLEHASVAPPDVVELVRPLGVTVVTQPIFLRERGDAYRIGVSREDRPWLYRCRGWLDAGVALGAGTDAPFGDPDPWRSMQAAVDRRSAQGAVLGAAEALDPDRALALFTTAAETPGGAPRSVHTGAVADLCLLDRPWARARDELVSDHVRATMRGGQISWQRP